MRRDCYNCCKEDEEEVCDRCNQNLYASNLYLDNSEEDCVCMSLNQKFKGLKQPNPNLNLIPNSKLNLSHDYYSFSNNSTLISQRDVSNYGNRNISPYQKEELKDTSGHNPLSPSSVSLDYINNIKSIYDKNKEQLEEKILLLSKELDHTRNKYNRELCSMHTKLLDQENKSKLELASLSDEHSSKLKSMISEKDNQIPMLINKNDELTKYNEELLSKLDNYLDTINNTKMALSARIANSQSESEHMRKELLRTKELYEKKIAFCNSEKEDEKNKLIYSYDNAIEQLKQEAFSEKERLVKIIESKDNELKNALESLRKEQEKNINYNTEHKSQSDKLSEERALLLKNNKELQENVNKLMNDLKLSKRETKAVLSEKLKYEEQSDQILRENMNLKIYNDKLNRLTHGKIKPS